MAESITIARPYAKAIFNHAVQSAQLSEWSTVLQNLTVAALDEKFVDFVTNPAADVNQHSELLLAVMNTKSPVSAVEIKSFITVLAYNKRLLVLPEITALYEIMRAEQDKTLTVTVKSYAELSAEQQQQLAASLTKRLQRQVTLHVTVDTALLGGAIINAGDLVIDGSVRGKLNKLKTVLAA